jgi:DHA1 family bicyclomycin/chloramphenicol resistance-like MFS transporter
LLTVFTPIGIDLYLPALPTIARDFGTPIAAIEHSLAAFFLGLCLGQAMVGPISDRFGRRWPILGGLGLYILGATGCALAQDPITLDFARFVEAVGGCAGTVLARACVRDLFPPHEAARIFAQMLLLLGSRCSRLRRRLAAAADRLAQPVLAAARRSCPSVFSGS